MTHWCSALLIVILLGLPAPWLPASPGDPKFHWSFTYMVKESSMEDLHLSLRRIRWISIVEILVLVVCGVAAGKSKPHKDAETEALLNKLNKPAVKTIKSIYGDIDCVDIYKQPAFDLPFLKNHDIEMRPSFIPQLEGRNFSLKLAKQVWQDSGSCPAGTIPILRVTKNDLLRDDSLQSFGMVQPNQPPVGRPEQAGFMMRSGRQVGPFYTGLAADMSVWNPEVEAGETSSSSIAALGLNNFDSVAAGWSVNQVLFEGRIPTFFIQYGARIENQTRVCINLRCPGFVQTSGHILLGGPLHHSVYGHEPITKHVMIYRDIGQRRWWLVVDGEAVGFWAFELFPDFDRAQMLMWRGVVFSREQGGLHTTTQMGSGHFAEEGWAKAAHFGKLQFMDSRSTTLHRARELHDVVAHPRCYNVRYPPRQGDTHGPMFYYGGPGGFDCARA